MPLTAEQKRHYLESKGVRCPFCRSREIASAPVQVDADTASAEAECNACGAKWIDQYALVGIEDIEE